MRFLPSCRPLGYQNVTAMRFNLILEAYVIQNVTATRFNLILEAYVIQNPRYFKLLLHHIRLQRHALCHQRLTFGLLACSNFHSPRQHQTLRFLRVGA